MNVFIRFLSYVCFIISRWTEGLYIVCPFSEIMLGETDTLVINQPDTKLQCGTFDTGVEKLSENYCYIQGGSSTQITITNAADGSPISGVLIHGFEMVSASIASIGAYADYDGALDGTSFSEDESLYQITVFDVHISVSACDFEVLRFNIVVPLTRILEIR